MWQQFNHLQVHGPGVDIDTLCIGPSYVNREVTLHLVTFPQFSKILAIGYINVSLFCRKTSSSFCITS